MIWYIGLFLRRRRRRENFPGLPPPPTNGLHPPLPNAPNHFDGAVAVRPPPNVRPLGCPYQFGNSAVGPYR